MADEIRILAVDDDELTLIVLRKTLETEHYVADTVTSARYAFVKLRENRYDAVLCDMFVPGMNGKQFYDDVGKEFPGTQKKVIFMTRDVASEANWDFIDGQGLPYVIKPFYRSLLLQQLTKVIGRSPAVSPAPPEPGRADRRLRRRIATDAKVKVEIENSGGSTHIGKMINASIKGVSFLSDRKYDVGAELVISYSYPNVISLPQSGKVVSCERNENGSWRVGVKL